MTNHDQVSVWIAWTCLWVASLGFAGCNSRDASVLIQNTPQANLDSLAEMQAAASQGNWRQAIEHSNAALLQHPGDPEVMSEIARVAFFAEKPGLAAELLHDACVLESFQNEERCLQTVVALIGVGKLYDGIELLEQAVASRPQHLQLRRWLYDFYVGTEDRLAALPHAKFLIRNRRFDADLLVSLSSMPRRSFDWGPLDEMVARNPSDQRPWLGRAKKLFDQGEYAASVELLDRILEQHPDSVMSIALKARVLAASSLFEKLQTLVDGDSRGADRYPDYWIAMGDLARSRKQLGQAGRAYWEATRIDSNVTEAWSKLAAVLRASDDVAEFDSIDVDAVYQRSVKLNELDRLVERFDQLHRTSPHQAVDIAESLTELGRLWEAEAWTALAISMRKPASERTTRARQSIVSKMSKTTPWQQTQGQSALQLDLSKLPMPLVSMAGNTRDASDLPENSSTLVALIAAKSPIELRNEANERGLNFSGWTRRDPRSKHTKLHETLGCGAGVIDYDLDGWPDLYLLAAGGKPSRGDSDPNALMRNQGGRFVDATTAAEVGETGFAQGVAVGDINEDGFADLLVLNFGPNRLFINNGDGTFGDATDRLGNNGNQQWSTSGAIADIDRDGISDAIVLNYCYGDNITTFNCTYETDGFERSCTPVVFPADQDQFYRTSRTGELVDQTSHWNAIPRMAGRGLGVVVGSFDEQSGLDIYIANDQTENHFWSAQGTTDLLQLMETGITRGLASNDRSLAQGSMGIAVGDLNLDQRVDFYVTNFSGEYNTLYEQQSGGTWKDSTAQKNLASSTLPMVGFGTVAADFDNNSLTELLVGNGNVDTYVADEVTNQPVLQTQPVQLFELDSTLKYQPIETDQMKGYMQKRHFGRGVWTFDVNRDGRIDVGVTHQTEPVAVLVNHTHSQNHWIELQLVGRASARDAVGARITLHSHGLNRVAWTTSGDGYLCSSERVVRLGVGNLSEACSITITWPDGSIQKTESLSLDARWLVVQGDDAFRMHSYR